MPVLLTHKPFLTLSRRTLPGKPVLVPLSERSEKLCFVDRGFKKSLSGLTKTAPLRGVLSFHPLKGDEYPERIFYGQSSFFAQKSQSISLVAHHPLYRSALAAFLQFHAAGVIWHPVLLLVSTVMGHHYRHYYGGRLLRGSIVRFQLF